MATKTNNDSEHELQQSLDENELDLVAGGRRPDYPNTYDPKNP